MSIDRDPKTISWKAAFELVETAFAVCVYSHESNLIYPLCYNDNDCIEIYFRNDDLTINIEKWDNLLIIITKTGNLIFKDTEGNNIELRLLNASPVIVP